MGNVDLGKSWNLVWEPFKNAVGGGFVELLSMLGVIVLVASLVTYGVKKWRGKGGTLGDLAWPIGIGAFFSAPDILFPMVLSLASFIVNIGIAIWNAMPWS